MFWCAVSEEAGAGFFHVALLLGTTILPFDQPFRTSGDHAQTQQGGGVQVLWALPRSYVFCSSQLAFAD